MLEPDGPAHFATANSSDFAAALGSVWLARLEMQSPGGSAAVLQLPPALPPGDLVRALVDVATRALKLDKTLLLLVADDELAPEFANTLDPAWRPLCLMLPGADFAASIVARATLALLKSRMARGGDDASSEIWATQSHRLNREFDAWQKNLAWATENRSGQPWPDSIADLFPLNFVASKHLPSLKKLTADFVVIIAPARQPNDASTSRCLLLRSNTRFGSVIPVDEDPLLRTQLAVLAQELGHMELELATIEAEVGSFAHRYYQQVGSLMTELDALRSKQARQKSQRHPDDRNAAKEASEAGERADRSSREQARYAEHAQTERPSFRPSTDLKRLYRQIAQKIHPDRANDEHDRVRRTRLMSDANLAYRENDLEALWKILRAWQQEGLRHEGKRARGELVNEIERLKQRLAAIEAEMRGIFSSRLYELFIANRLAGRSGRNLLEEMANELATQIFDLRKAVTE